MSFPDTNALKPWVLAARPKTLFAGLCPVLLGLSYAFTEFGTLHWPSALATLLCTLAMQIGTNYVNDYYDADTGVDGDERLGPLRAIHLDLISASQLKKGYRVILGFAFLLGLSLIWRGGLPIAILGISSLLFAYIYTAGPFPLSHYALGELTAFFFFGPIAVWGTVYIQSPQVQLLTSIKLWSLGGGVGLISATIMAINNLRDRASDRKKGKKTLAVFLGEKGGRYLCLSFITLSILWPLFLTQSHGPWVFLLASLAFAPFLSTWRGIHSAPISREFNDFLADTGKYLFLYTIALSASIIASSYVGV